VRVLLRGGRREAEEVDVAGVVEFALDAVGEGVDVSDSSSIRSSACILAIRPQLCCLDRRSFTFRSGPVVRRRWHRFVTTGMCMVRYLGADLSAFESVEFVY